jgi:hypothetical protein
MFKKFKCIHQCEQLYKKNSLYSIEILVISLEIKTKIYSYVINIIKRNNYAEPII